jgi:hypothetical protein
MRAPYGSAADTPLDRRARWVSPSFALRVGARILGIRVSGGGRHTSAGRQHDRPRLEPWRCAPPRAQENCFRLTRRRPTGPRRAICAGAPDPGAQRVAAERARRGRKRTTRTQPGTRSGLPGPGVRPNRRKGSGRAQIGASRHRPVNARRSHPLQAHNAPAYRPPGSPASQLGRLCRPSVSGYDARSPCGFWENGSDANPPEEAVREAVMILGAS